MLSSTGFLLCCMSESIEKVALSIPENILVFLARDNGNSTTYIRILFYGSDTLPFTQPSGSTVKETQSTVLASSSTTEFPTGWCRSLYAGFLTPAPNKVSSGLLTHYWY